MRANLQIKLYKKSSKISENKPNESNSSLMPFLWTFKPNLNGFKLFEAIINAF